MNLIEQIQAKRDQERFNACVYFAGAIVVVALLACASCRCGDPTCPASAEHVGKYHAGEHR